MAGSNGLVRLPGNHPLAWLSRRRPSPGALVMTPLFVILMIVDVALQPDILTKPQIALTIQTALPLVLVSAAQCVVLLTGGIDVSVGGMMVVANVLTAVWAGSTDERVWLLLAIPVIGLVLGAINGALVVFGRFEPFVATLGTWAIYDGIALQILPSAGGETPAGVTNWAQDIASFVPTSILLLVLLLLFWWYWRSTNLCRHIYSIGSDEIRSALSGIDIGRTKFSVYAISGLLSALAGVYLALITGTGDATIGNGYILSSVEACVLGGISLTGGTGGIGMAVAGAFILTFIEGIASVLEMPPWVSVVLSAALLLAVIGIRSRLVKGLAL
jgi:ribose transport system permease protein